MMSKIDPAQNLLEAVEGFATRVRPGNKLERQLCDLVIPYLPDIDLHIVRRISVSLCQLPHAPRELLTALCKFPVRVCGVILTYSPVLRDADLETLIEQDATGEFALAIARRKELSQVLIETLTALGDERVDRALDIRRHPLARSANKGLNVPITQDPIIEVDAVELAMLAADPEVGLFATAISDHLSLSMPSAVALVSNPTSRNLIIALRHLRIETNDAFLVFSALAPDIASRANVEEKFREQFDRVTLGEAARQIQEWQIDDLVAMLRQHEIANSDHAAETRRSA